jgi:hypothetical protein
MSVKYVGDMKDVMSSFMGICFMYDPYSYDLAGSESKVEKMEKK